MHDLNDLYYFAGRPERRLRARRPGALSQVAAEPAHRAAGGTAGRAPDPALDPQLRGHGAGPGIPNSASRCWPAPRPRRKSSTAPTPSRKAIRLSAAGADPLFPGRADRALHGQVPGAGLPEELQPSGGRAARGYDLAVRVRFGPIESSDLVMKPRHERPAPGRRAAGARGALPRIQARSASCRRWRWASTDAKATGRDGPDGARLSVPFSPPGDRRHDGVETGRRAGRRALPSLMIREELADGRLVDGPWAPSRAACMPCFHRAGDSCPACASCWIWAPNTRSWPGANARNAGSWANAPARQWACSPAVGLPTRNRSGPRGRTASCG